jgi:hypothetical protein
MMRHMTTAMALIDRGTDCADAVARRVALIDTAQ